MSKYAVTRIAVISFLWSAIVLGNVWATKNGSPQHVWFYCDMLGWCSK